jgi:hypothetical protein
MGQQVTKSISNRLPEFLPKSKLKKLLEKSFSNSSLEYSPIFMPPLNPSHSYQKRVNNTRPDLMNPEGAKCLRRFCRARASEELGNKKVN